MYDQKGISTSSAILSLCLDDLPSSCHVYSLPPVLDFFGLSVCTPVSSQLYLEPGLNFCLFVTSATL